MAPSKALPAAAITLALLLFVMIFEADTTLPYIQGCDSAGAENSPEFLMDVDFGQVGVSEGIL